VTALPPGACDCHAHVFGPPGRYPFDPGRTYTPGVASVDQLRALHAALGISRVVIVQPSPYGTDNRCTLDAVRHLGDHARAVAVIAPDLGQADLAALAQAGVRGIRLNLETAGQHDPAIAAEMLRHAGQQVAPLGWHMQVYTNLGMLAALRDEIRALPVPLVVDHFGRAGSVDQPGFDALLDLVRSGRAWVKLSAAHRMGPPEAVADVARALIEANPDQMLWGTDWPHTGARAPGPGSREEIEPFDPVDDAAALNRLREWAGDEAMLRRILVDNPARLYGFA